MSELEKVCFKWLEAIETIYAHHKPGDEVDELTCDEIADYRAREFALELEKIRAENRMIAEIRSLR
jgi:hypothetical protein